MRFGAYDDEVLSRLRWMRDVLGPVLADAVERLGGLELKPLMAQALLMGDEVHNRNAAATSLLFRKLVPAVLSGGKGGNPVEPGRARDALDFIAGNDHFFLNLSMAACKCMLDAAHGVPHSSLVTAMARNGVNFGIRVSGLGNRWFQAESPFVDGLFFPGYGPDDAARDLGDSAITESAGLGGFAMAAAPAIVQFVGGQVQDAINYSTQMYEITVGEGSAYKIPSLDFRGSATGIDLLKVVETGIRPIINPAIGYND